MWKQSSNLFKVPRIALIAAVLSSLVLVAAIGCSGDDDTPATSPPATATTQAAAATSTSVPATEIPAPVSDGKRGGELIRGVSSLMPRGWDMRRDAVWTGPQNSGRHYDGLLQWNQVDGVTIEADLASEWNFNSTFDSVTLKVREGIKFHDGSAMTMDDVVFSFEQFRTPPEGVVFPRLSGFQSVESITVSGQEITFKLESPNVDFLQDLASIWAIIVPEAVASQEGGINDPDRIIGTGPFMLSEAEADSFITSKKNPDYFLEAPDGDMFPYLDTLTTVAIPDASARESAFRTGRIDIFQGTLEQADILGKDLGPDITIQVAALPGVFHIAMNAEKPPFDNIKARRAFDLAIDRVAITEFQAIPAGKPYVPVSYLGNPYPFLDEIMDYPEVNPATRDAAKAESKALFAELGITEVEMLVINFAWFEEWAQLAAQQLSDVGVTMKLEVKDASASLASAQASDYQLFGHGGNNVVWSAMDVVKLFYMPNGGWFYHKAPPTQEFIDIYTDAKATLPGPERDALIRRMEEILRTEVIPAANIMASAGIRQIYYNYVRDRFATPAAHFQAHKFTEVWIDENSPRK